ncbi:hypothetical protein QUF70_03730, partial [Desulfobacterales bacterium HSG17]|nr:hypothetical protein [Desulfobacterales bacterium HSG17]
MLGIEYVCIDHDARDADLSKKFFNNNNFKRYSLAFVESQFWDKYYGITNISYPTIPHLGVNKDAKFVELEEDYKIVVLSFSRLNQVLPQLGQILYVLEQFDENYLFSQFQTWHYAMIYFMREILNCSEFELLSNYRTINIFGHNITQFLKFEMIEGLKTDHDIEIYGDEYWKFIFPDYYKGWLDNKEQIDELFSHNNCLYLLLNWAPSIFTSNPHLYNAIKRKNPFVCYAPLAKTDEFKGFEHIEYDNITKLNHIVENIRDIFKNPVLLQAIKNQQSVLETSSKFFENSILSNKDSQYQFEFERMCSKTIKKIDQKVYRFMDKNEVLLRGAYDFLFKESVSIDISKSKFFKREYVQKIVKLTPQDLKLS